MVYIRDLDLTGFRTSDDGKGITLVAQSNDFDSPQGPVAFMDQRQRCLLGTATATLIHPFSGTKLVDKAGLAYHKIGNRFVRLTCTMLSAMSFCIRSIVSRVFLEKSRLVSTLNAP